MMNFIKRLLIVAVVTLVVLSMYTCVAHAEASPGIEPKVQPMMIAVGDDEIDILAKLVYAEARGVGSTMEQAAVIWCALNRVDNGAWGDTITDVVTAPHQFAYDEHTPVKDEFHTLAEDVVRRWIVEKMGADDVGRVLPAEYLFFAGHGGHNRFRIEYEGNGEYWDWSLPDPYTEG